MLERSVVLERDDHADQDPEQQQSEDAPPSHVE
jgi:hypothetical protein